MSSVWVPIDPVDPRTATRRVTTSGYGSHPAGAGPYRQCAQRHAGSTSNDAGGFEVFFENDLGATRRMRADDGVHFTRSGSNWLSRELYEVLRTIWQIPPS